MLWKSTQHHAVFSVQRRIRVSRHCCQCGQIHGPAYELQDALQISTWVVFISGSLNLFPSLDGGLTCNEIQITTECWVAVATGPDGSGTETLAHTTPYPLRRSTHPERFRGHYGTLRHNNFHIGDVDTAQYESLKRKSEQLTLQGSYLQAHVLRVEQG